MNAHEVLPGQAFRLINRSDPNSTEPDNTVFVALRESKYVNTTTWALAPDGFEIGVDVKLVGDINELMNGNGMVSIMFRNYLKK